MSFLGLYTKKEVEKIKQINLIIGKIEGECEKRIQNLKRINNLENIILDKNIKISNLELEVDILIDKDINKLETLAIKTNKLKVKKKCESRILKHRERKLQLE